MKELLDLLMMAESEKRTTKIYRGTVEPEIIAEFKEARRQLEVAEEAYKVKHDALWERICAALSLPPESDYTLNQAEEVNE